jgi:hypothetical protein
MRRRRGGPQRILALIGSTALLLITLVILLPASGRAGARWWQLPAHPRWYWQLQGRLHVPAGVTIVDVDGFGTSAGEVRALQRSGHRVVCYIDVGTSENWRPDAHRFPASVLGASNGWPGERWLNIARTGVIEPIMASRLRMCAQKHFDAVEADNLDPSGNHTGFRITRAEVLTYARWLAERAHALGLAILQKNGPELSAALEPAFDGALTEQCRQYDECGAFAPYLRARKPVLDAEYDSALYPGFCRADARMGISGALYDLALDGRGVRACPTSG